MQIVFCKFNIFVLLIIIIPQFRNPTKSLRALCPKTAKNEIFLVRTDFLPRVGRYASIMPPYPHLGLQTTAPPKRLAHP